MFSWACSCGFQVFARTVDARGVVLEKMTAYDKNGELPQRNVNERDHVHDNDTPADEEIEVMEVTGATPAAEPEPEPEQPPEPEPEEEAKPERVAKPAGVRDGDNSIFDIIGGD